MGLDLWHVIPSKEVTLEFFQEGDFFDRPDLWEKFKPYLQNEPFAKQIVLYWSAKGYQRKGAKPEFYEQFENEKLYFSKEDVRRAYDLIEVDCQHSFEQDFVNNFIEGESIFLASW